MPHGSILGITLFLLFINDFLLHLEACSSDIYADGTTVHTNNKHTDTAEFRLQREFNNSNDWSKENKLPLNLNKTTCMTLGTRMRLSNCRELNLHVNDISIQNVTSQKLLGKFDMVKTYSPFALSHILKHLTFETTCWICSDWCSKTFLSWVYISFDRWWICHLGIDILR